jgi:putative ABC transport system permease protein
MKYLYLLFSSLKRKKLRTGLTILSIMVAFVLFGYLSAIRQAFDAGIEVAGVDRLIVRHKVSIIQLLPQNYEAKIEAIEGVDNAMHQTWFGGIYQEPKNFFAQIPVVPEEMFDLYPEIIISDEHKQAWLNNRAGAIVGKGLIKRFGWKVGDRIPINATIWTKNDGGRTWEFDIVGVYDGAEKGTDTSQLFFRYDYFDETRANGKGLVGWYVVRVSDPDRAAEVAAAIDAEFANSPQETKAEPEGAFVQGFANQIGNIGFIIMSIMTAVFFTILLVAGNTMAYTVRERTSELAVLKALGFTDTGVLALVLGESLIITLVGGAIGLGLAWLMVSVGGDPTSGSFPVFYIPVSSLLGGLGLIIFMAFVAGILPALQAQRLQIADALRR